MLHSTPAAEFTTGAPVAAGHTILDADALAQEVARHWALATPMRCQLLQHGQNDWYRLQTGRAVHAVRVLKSGLRQPQELAEEISWSRALADSGLPVVAAMPTARAAPGITVASAEGPRMVCVYPWIEGRTLDRGIDSADAAAAGRLLAQVHQSSAQLPVGARRHSLVDKLARTAPALDAALTDDTERRIVATARAAAAPALATEATLPQGSLHGDVHFGNLRLGNDGRHHLMDFDDCGRGARVVDLTPYLWRNRSEDLDTRLDQAFLEAYQSSTALTATECSLLPGLLLARCLYLTGVLARDRNRLGTVPGFDRPWSHYLGLLRRLTQAL